MKKFIIPALVLLSACNSTPKEEIVEDLSKGPDPHSFANYHQNKVNHLDLELKIDFDQKRIDGLANWTFSRNDSNLYDTLVLDVKNLVVDNVMHQNGSEAWFELDGDDELLGSALRIALSQEDESVAIAYHTTDSSDALQWTSPEQTYDKTHPFLYTQSQAILARTWIPCQDSPGVRFTYNARVKAPSDIMAVMSASNPQEMNSEGVYTYEMELPIPSYLMALAAGHIAFQSVGERTGVYAEPGQLASAAYEFAQMEEMVEATESIYGPYAWGRYDLIVLPPSFPFGGMENPRMTFVTPTVIAGDRSLTSLIAHELAHSWSGNLVTNATWDDFWLNEGFTTYIERRIMEEVYGEDYAEMLLVLGYQDLEQDIEDLRHEGHAHDTRLKLSLEGRDPDDGMTDIAYEKGANFLRTLEEGYGRPAFDSFVLAYFDHFKFQSITTEDFLAFADSNLFAQDSILKRKLMVQNWIYGENLPPVVESPSSERFSRVNSALIAWADGSFTTDEIETDQWTTHEWLHFIRHLPNRLTVDQLADLDAAYNFTNSGNSEIQAAWFMHTIRAGYDPADEQLEAFLIRVGRRKFLTPLYKTLDEYQPERAREIYSKARGGYHSVATNTLDNLLK